MTKKKPLPRLSKDELDEMKIQASFTYAIIKSRNERMVKTPHVMPDLPLEVPFDNELQTRALKEIKILGDYVSGGTLPIRAQYLIALVEARYSSLIEGIDVSYEQLFDCDRGQIRKGTKKPFEFDFITETHNIYKTMVEFGLRREELDFANKEVAFYYHLELLAGSKISADKMPGKIRDRQCYVVSQPGNVIQFVPPIAETCDKSLDTLFWYLESEKDSPNVLADIGMSHGYFESIHPFADGNGRVGRMLIAHQLSTATSLPVIGFGISRFISENKQGYYGCLSALRQGDGWEFITDFILRGIAATAEDLTERIAAYHKAVLEERAALALLDDTRAHVVMRQAYNAIARMVVGNVPEVSDSIDCSHPEAYAAFKRLEELGYVRRTPSECKRGAQTMHSRAFDLIPTRPLRWSAAELATMQVEWDKQARERSEQKALEGDKNAE